MKKMSNVKKNNAYTKMLREHLQYNKTHDYKQGYKSQHA